MKNKGSVLLYVLIFLCSLNTSISAQKLVRIQGNITNSNVPSLELIDFAGGSKLAGADIGPGGSFDMSLTVIKSTLCKLQITPGAFVSLILNPGEQISIRLDFNKLNQPEISGSPESELIYRAYNELVDYDRKLDEFTRQTKEEKLDYTRGVIRNNKESLAVLFFIEQIDVEENTELFKEVSESLSAKYPGDPLVENFNRKIRDAVYLSVGNPAPEIHLSDPEGQERSLSSLKGKIVLIDFWASWCGPCRRENPNLVRIYNKYKDKGFEIFGVSLDRDRQSWVNTIKSDSMSWIHVSDLKYWQSEVVSLYGFQGIPYTVLLDKEGNILAKSLRGESLEAKLEEIFR